MTTRGLHSIFWRMNHMATSVHNDASSSLEMMEHPLYARFINNLCIKILAVISKWHIIIMG